MRTIVFHLLAPLAACGIATGCTAMRTEAGGNAAGETDLEAVFETACEDPRPEVCTREYRPVCALRDTGIRCVTTPCDSSERRTYGNACTACSDKDVYGYDAGACAE